MSHSANPRLPRLLPQLDLRAANDAVAKSGGADVLETRSVVPKAADAAEGSRQPMRKLIGTGGQSGIEAHGFGLRQASQRRNPRGGGAAAVPPPPPPWAPYEHVYVPSLLEALYPQVSARLSTLASAGKSSRPQLAAFFAALHRVQGGDPNALPAVYRLLGVKAAEVDAAAADPLVAQLATSVATNEADASRLLGMESAALTALMTTYGKVDMTKAILGHAIMDRLFAVVGGPSLDGDGGGVGLSQEFRGAARKNGLGPRGRLIDPGASDPRVVYQALLGMFTCESHFHGENPGVWPIRFDRAQAPELQRMTLVALQHIEGLDLRALARRDPIGAVRIALALRDLAQAVEPKTAAAHPVIGRLGETANAILAAYPKVVAAEAPGHAERIARLK